MYKSLKKKLPLVGLTVLFASSYVLFSSMFEGKPLLETFRDPDAWIFMVIVAVIYLLLFRRECT